MERHLEKLFSIHTQLPKIAKTGHPQRFLGCASRLARLYACDSFLNTLIQAQLISREAVATVNSDSETAHMEYTAKVGNRIDIALLGAGPDSYTCSLFSRHSSIENPSETFILVTDSPKPPASRISMSRSMLEKTGCVFVFFISEGKRDTYHNFMDDSVTITDAPVKISRQARKCLVFTDLP